jgi:hypothetical protein
MFEGGLRERVRCSSLVDWPVYPRLAHTMQASNGGRNVGRTHRSSGHSGQGQTYGTASERRSGGCLCGVLDGPDAKAGIFTFQARLAAR